MIWAKHQEVMFANVNSHSLLVPLFLYIYNSPQLWTESNHLEYWRRHFRGWEYLYGTKIEWYLCERVSSPRHGPVSLLIYSLTGELIYDLRHPSEMSHSSRSKICVTTWWLWHFAATAPQKLSLWLELSRCRLIWQASKMRRPASRSENWNSEVAEDQFTPGLRV